MKTTLILLLLSSSLMAKEMYKNYDLGLTNIKVFNDADIPALSLDIKPKSMKKVNIKLAYTNEFLIEQSLLTPSQSQNPESENLHVSLTYKF